VLRKVHSNSPFKARMSRPVALQKKIMRIHYTVVHEVDDDVDTPQPDPCSERGPAALAAPPMLFPASGMDRSQTSYSTRAGFRCGQAYNGERFGSRQ
jgi:hypothetical protein